MGEELFSREPKPWLTPNIKKVVLNMDNKNSDTPPEALQYAKRVEENILKDRELCRRLDPTLVKRIKFEARDVVRSGAAESQITDLVMAQVFAAQMNVSPDTLARISKAIDEARMANAAPTPLSYSTPDEGVDYPEMAKKIVHDWSCRALGANISIDQVYVVWFSKTLQNWKALVSTAAPDGRYYEVTYDGDKRLVYLDTYTKTHNVALETAPKL